MVGRIKYYFLMLMEQEELEWCFSVIYVDCLLGNFYCWFVEDLYFEFEQVILWGGLFILVFVEVVCGFCVCVVIMKGELLDL